jgi:hypothetical protein
MQRNCRVRTFTAGSNTPSPTSVRSEVGGAVNLWYFQSPKNRRGFIFCGELVFLQAILLEADRTVAGYGSPGGTSRARTADTRGADLIATGIDGSETEYITRYVERNPQASKQAAALPDRGDIRTIVITDKLLETRHVEIENWLFLCAAMTRVRKYAGHIEAEALRRLVQSAGGATIGQALDENGIDRACMLGAIANGLQNGSVTCETATAPLTLSSVLQIARPS